MKYTGIIILLLTLHITAWANVTLRGHVRSMLTQEALPDAEVRADGLTASVITNEDGFFALKLESMPKRLAVSALGHKDATVDCSTLTDVTSDLNVWMEPDVHILSTVTIFSAEDIVRKALAKVPDNYTKSTERLSCFYRETIRKQNHYVGLSEAVMDVYKTDYSHGVVRDRVQIRKGRALMSQRSRDTLSVKVMGGPQESVLIDLVKNRDLLFYQDDLSAYHYEMEPGTSIGNRLQFVIRFHPKETRDYALYSGTIYVDAERLAFTRIETSLDMSDTQKATNMMLMKKPRGLRFKPKALNTTVSYYYDGQCSRISYVRNVYQFNCDWRRRLFATSYRAVSEMVVTDYAVSDMPKGHRNMFSRYDVLSSDVADFDDTEFWEAYNIIEPSESLEYAVKRLKKRAQ